MNVEQVQISERPLIDAYRRDFGQVQEFFVYDPSQPESFQRRYQTLCQAQFPRREVVEALEIYNRQIGASQKTMENIQRLADEKTVAVLTGQQAGVVTGPLYTIYKALTVVQLAERLTADGIPAVPVFWIASEDHDFYEIAGVTFLNREQEKVEVRLQGEVERQPVGYLQLQSEVEEFIRTFAAETPDTEFKPAIIEQIRELATKAANLAEWFARLMTWLFTETGLVFVDSLDPALRHSGKDFFLKAFEQNEEITKCLQDAEKRLRAKGFPAQILKNPGQVHLFMLEDAARYPVEKGEKGYYLRGQNAFYSHAEFAARIAAGPEMVSTNVVTRPLFQDILFPTIAYVGGPGETAYYAQYRRVYELFEMEMPVIYPRASLTLIEKTIAKGLKKNNLSLLDLHYRYDEIRQRLLQEADELNLRERFGLFKRSLISEHQQLINDLQQLDPKFKQLGAQNLERLLAEITYLEDKAYHQHRKHSEDLLRQLHKLKINLSPDGNLQERCLNIFPYLFKYQLQLIDNLNQLDLLAGSGHYLVYL